ncbi:metal-sulfur cluster assembly factor [Deinococcus cellulosilyticus]|uniref:Metal-sulfur cluster biosynthetic enzyme n=1 Tax=Deinococcus cellulosilyticus (strain DSM 18568 / NBRC 106333 / KACC 11606 / 5516J-15) TaxID=1223518 RepID=A0A511MYV6_DEIC1|nr:metal-sulfur cluster assembly factor [Deinococcus cellulosilyticus]GEM45521.1 metal-sulfur cluster biosynthetic enzyme [Deinococcus cellulosilyticus NBRC 106333 = KACC 11606]
MSAENLKELAGMLLQNVLDPELGISIVDLGLVYGVDIEESTLRVTMTLTTPGCPLHDTLTDAVRRTLERMPGIEEVQVDLVWQPAWTPERITPEGKRQLGWR